MLKKRMWLSAALSALMIANTLPSGVMAAETATAFDPGDTTEKPLILWYNKPSAKTADIIDNSVLDRAGWDEYSLPIGNGYNGASIFGRLDTERVQIADKTLANPYRSDPTGKLGHSRGGLNSFADVYIDFNQEFDSASNYTRSLNIRDAVATVDYEYDGVTYHREYIDSYPDNVIAIKITASKPGSVSFTLHPENPYVKDYGLTEGDGQGKTGTVSADAENGRITLGGTMEYYQIQYETQVQLINENGTITGNDTTLTLNGADSAVIMIALDTNYELESDVFTKAAKEKLADKPHPHEKITERLNTAVEKGYDSIKSDHIADYKTYFDRMELDLGGTFNDTYPTDELVSKYKDGSINRRYLEELYFQYGRYLLIASSRKGALPAHLQGAWNAYDSSPWTAGYWHNINVQMNYWPVFTTNLAEMFESYEDYNKAYMYSAEEGADKYLAVWGNDKDNVVPHQNGWGVGTGGYPYGIAAPPTETTHSGPGTSALTAMMFYDQYDYTRDSSKLENDYKAVSGVANFLSKALYDHDGTYLIEHSASPENANKRISPGCAFDQQMTYEVYKETLELNKKMNNESSELTNTINKQIDHLDPVLIGLDGQVKEYRDEGHYNQYADGTSGEAGHRHVSQLKGLYPGTSINDNTKAWLDGAKVTLQKRGMSSNLPGWAFAHRMNLWARVKDGTMAYECYKKVLTNSTNPNLWNTHPYKTFQIDGNLGTIAGIAETLMQSHSAYIDLLPALSPVWTRGSVKGLVARGNFEVDIDWADSTVTEAKIRSRADTEEVSVGCYNIASATVTDSQGNNVSFTADGKDKITFATTKGEEYTITNIPAHETINSPSNVNVKYSYSADNKSAVVSWTGSDNAESYNVYRAADNAADYELLGTSDTTSFSFDVTKDDIQKQTTYRVTAVKDGRESDGATKLIEKSTIRDDAGTPVDAEDFTGQSYDFDTLNNMGWSETYDPMRVKESADYGTFSVANDSLNISKTSDVNTPSDTTNSQTVYSAVKTFEQKQENYDNNERVTLRQNDFKGKYALDMYIALPHTTSSSWIDFLGYRNGNKGVSVGRFTNNSDKISIYNNKLNTTASQVPMWSGTTGFTYMRIVFDSATSTFQVYKDDSLTPAKTTGTLQSGASADTFSMTNWGKANNGAYLSGVRFAANKDMTPTDFVKIKSLKLYEIERMADTAVDSAVAAITIDKLTSTPECVEQNITLPQITSDDAEVTWTSSDTSVIGNDGTFYGSSKATDVTMTAQITNKTDSFTVYKDFRLSVPGEETVKLSKTFDDNGMNVTVKNNSSDSLTIKVTVGVYNDNDTLNTAKLQTVTLDSKAEQTISFAGITSDKSVSIFAWDEDMTPLTNVLK